MKILKNTLIVSSYVLLMALFFGGGYAVGRRSTATEEDASPVFTETHTETDNSPQKIEVPVYEVIVEDGVLRINKCIGKIKTEVTSEEISENVFPSSDINELKEGVIFERLEDAQQLFENFVS